MNIRAPKSFPSLIFIILLILLSAPLVDLNAYAQGLKPIYDGRLSPSPGKPPSNLERLLKDRVLPAAGSYWREEEEDQDCIEGYDPVALDIAEGAFTKPESRQKAILYRFCTKGGPNAALNGIAVVENDRVVSHVAFEGSIDAAIGALPDINGDGRSEILIASGGTHMGETWRSISIIELSDTIVLTKFGGSKVYWDNCSGAIRKGKGRTEAHRLTVKAGKSPVFYRQTYMNKGDCTETGHWIKSGGLKQFSLENDDGAYQFVKTDE